MKIVINTCYGGFGLSEESLALYNQKAGTELKYVFDIERTDPHLVAVVEELGPIANGSFSSLKVVEIPDDVKWHISEYDGLEHIAEEHRTWQ